MNEAQNHDGPRFYLCPSRCVLVEVAAAITGYSEKAIRRKIQEGIWVQGKVWHKAPDGRLVIDLDGYEKWARGEDKEAA